MRQVGRLVLANGMALRCTPDHPIFTQRGWVNAQKLAPDDTVAVLDTVAAADLRVAARRRPGAQGGSMVLAEVPIIWSTPLSYTTEGTEPTYDIEVPGAANFIAGVAPKDIKYASIYDSFTITLAMLLEDLGHVDRVFLVGFGLAHGVRRKLAQLAGSEAKSQRIQLEPPRRANVKRHDLAGRHSSRSRTHPR
jgi:hypothetical protein